MKRLLSVMSAIMLFTASCQKPGNSSVTIKRSYRGTFTMHIGSEVYYDTIFANNSSTFYIQNSSLQLDTSASVPWQILNLNLYDDSTGVFISAQARTWDVSKQTGNYYTNIMEVPGFSGTTTQMGDFTITKLHPYNTTYYNNAYDTVNRSIITVSSYTTNSSVKELKGSYVFYASYPDTLTIWGEFDIRK